MNSADSVIFDALWQVARFCHNQKHNPDETKRGCDYCQFYKKLDDGKMHCMIISVSWEWEKSFQEQVKELEIREISRDNVE